MFVLRVEELSMEEIAQALAIRATVRALLPRAQPLARRAFARRGHGHRRRLLVRRRVRPHRGWRAHAPALSHTSVSRARGSGAQKRSIQWQRVDRPAPWNNISFLQMPHPPRPDAAFSASRPHPLSTAVRCSPAVTRSPRRRGTAAPQDVRILNTALGAELGRSRPPAGRRPAAANRARPGAELSGPTTKERRPVGQDGGKTGRQPVAHKVAYNFPVDQLKSRRPTCALRRGWSRAP